MWVFTLENASGTEVRLITETAGFAEPPSISKCVLRPGEELRSQTVFTFGVSDKFFPSRQNQDL